MWIPGQRQCGHESSIAASKLTLKKGIYNLIGTFIIEDNPHCYDLFLFFIKHKLKSEKCLQFVKTMLNVIVDVYDHYHPHMCMSAIRPF